MSTMIQIRNVPDELHRRIKARAAMEGTSMSRFLLREIEKSHDRPTRAELIDRMAVLPVDELDPTPAELVRAERDRR